ncbi:MAG: cation:proton antiporter [Candidatus Omnitrophica bacterium]|nr:cation:proton antiporter [Candidatus Omnitrophota bacterium]MBU1127909.1 cation:proton antiporter [Candidatus Omnitrophota bacterium]MBU1784593.1 cation:proton antiporter [Candidatus Omnitrophota bacterium]MBU1850912.1 cation:proton antiporter [Candidatus Omnitrophota bacterium]
MNAILFIGIIVFVGFIFGEIAEKIRLPKVAGYIVAGVLMDPEIWTFIPANFMRHADIVTNVALSFITFSIGGSIFYPHIKKLGKGIIYITLLEAEFAFLAIFFGFLLVTPFFAHIPGGKWAVTFIPLSLLIASLGAPTDPSATLAIKAQYHPKGEVISTMLSVAAFDDVLGIINYSIAVVIAQALVMQQRASVETTLLAPMLIITGSIVLGIVFGFLLNVITKFIRKETEGVFITVLFGLLAICFGLSTLTGADELLSTMVMGIVVVNFNPKREKIFSLLERYVDELIFVLFFTLSGMHMIFSIFLSTAVLSLFFLIFRFFGKFFGTALGATIAKSSPAVKKYTVGGLIPQGGIVIGLALMIKQNPAFSGIADIIISVIIGTTIINEFVGPITTKFALKRAGELSRE